MLDEFRKSAQLILRERITSPLSGALILSWFLWNWKVPYILLFDNALTSASDRISFVESHYTTWNQSLIYPILSALFLIIIYPFATTGALSIWLRFKRWQANIRNEIEKSQLLTLEQSLQLRSQLRRLQEEVAKLIAAKDDEIAALKKENESLRQSRDAAANVPAAQPVHVPITPPLSPKAKELLAEAVKDPQGAIIVVEHTTGKYYLTNSKNFGSESQPRLQAEWESAFDELLMYNFIRVTSESSYSVTKAGFEFSDTLGGAA